MPAARSLRALTICTFLAAICAMAGCSDQLATWVFGSTESAEHVERWDSRFRTPPDADYQRR